MKTKILAWIRRNYLIFISAICVIFFGILAYYVKISDSLLLDTSFFEALFQIRSSFFTFFFFLFTFLASKEFIILVCFILILISLIKKNYLYTLLIIINTINSVLLNQGLKKIFFRERPSEFFLLEEEGYSFPSGHTMAAITFYGYFIFLIWKSTMKKQNKIIWTIFLSIIILLIGVSRIYLGVHYTTDVLAGYLIGFAYLCIYIHCTKKYLSKNEKDGI